MNIVRFLKTLKPSSVGLINLGCARNVVDSQHILALIEKLSHQVVDPTKAQVIIVNTCAFVDDAKKETIDTLLDLVDLKKKGKIKTIIVLGCFVQRYSRELKKEFNDIDFMDGILPLDQKKVRPSMSLTPASFTYLKICESCYNHCSFCAIPLIKGRFISRSMPSILKEAQQLDKQGFKEMNIIGQDITAYGVDLYKKKMLSELLTQLAQQAQSVQWIRLLYCFPSHITDDLIHVMSQEEKICHYIDLPLQHISDRILKSMNRPFFRNDIEKLIYKIRNQMPDVCLRTTFIVGYPGETKKEFDELLSFVKDSVFDRVGVFKYSREEGTLAAQQRGHISDQVKQERYQSLMDAQQSISQKKAASYVGQQMSVLIDQKDTAQQHVFIGRTMYDAPDVDGIVFVHSKKRLKSGDMVKAKITDSYEYDLVAELV